MVKSLLFFSWFFGSYLVTKGNRGIIDILCCTCSDGKAMDVSYTDCVSNSTCAWTCSNSENKKCGPLFLDPSVKEGPPMVSSVYKTFNTVQDQWITIPCKILSNPAANVTWLFEGTDIYSYPDKRDHYTDTTKNCDAILKMRVLKSDEGSYTCVAQNAKGSGNKTFKVTVEAKRIFKPHVTDLSIDTEEHKAYLGATFNLSCQVNFNPTVDSIAQIIFSRHRKIVRDVEGKYENFPRANVDGPLHTRKLSLKNVTFKEEGNWTCYGVENGIKGDYESIFLKIVPCPAGYYCPWNESKKYECPYGTYSDGSRNITYQCTPCPRANPTSKPHEYYGPAKSFDECPIQGKLSKDGSNDSLIVSIVASCLVIPLLIGIVVKIYKSKKRILANTTSESEPVPTPGVTQDAAYQSLVVNDYCAITNEATLFSSVAETPEFPVLYDIFISYSSKDVDFAMEIQRELERKDFKCCIHIRDFTPGDTILNNISNAIYGSRVTLAILSPDFVESEWCKGELQQALTRSMRNHRVIPILYKNCQIPIELLHRTYIDYENCYVKPYFWNQLEKALAALKATVETNL